MVPFARVDAGKFWSRPCGVLGTWLFPLALATSSCGSETAITFTVAANGPPQGQRLRLIAITEAGRVPGSALLPEDDRPLLLPGTVAVKVPNKDSLVGLLLQLENDRGQVVARGRTNGCVTSASPEPELQIQLQSSLAAWEADFISRCTCEDGNARSEMCPLPIVAADAGVTADAMVMQPPPPPPPPVNVDAGPNMPPFTPDGGMMPPPPPPDAAAMPNMSPSALFGFEDAQGWTSPQLTLSRDTTMRSQGEASLTFTATSQPAAITSRAFRTNEFGPATPTLRLDLFLAQAQDFGASLQIVLHCPNAGIFEQYLTWHALQPLPSAKWVSLDFALTPDTVGKLAQPAEGCQLRIAVQGAGAFRLDNLVFVR